MNFSNPLFSNLTAIEIPMSKQCQLRCSYCYIHDQKYKITQVSEEEILKVYQTAREVFPKWETLSDPFIVPWGAEPLANWDVIDSVLRKIIQDIPHIKISFSTNAVYLPQKFKEFIQEWTNHLSIQISFDGPEAVQNSARVFSDGSGSFDKVYKNVLYLIENYHHTKMLNFKSTLSPQQIEAGMYDQAVQFFLTELKFKTDPVTFVYDVPYSKQSLTELRNSFKRLKNKWEDIKNINPEATLGVFHNIINHSSTVYCSALKTQISIDLNGDIYPCHGPTTDDHLKEYFKMGNIFDGTIDHKGLTRTLFAYGNSRLLLSPLCQNCIVFKTDPNFCHICPMDSINSTGISWARNISICNLRREIIQNYLEWVNDKIIV